ncbi:hypothetical protein [Nocardia sp. NPDC056000]|uniref:hypothetical protein n=1 Tax=Nocardia sp. NPDC056000 TaxID=3345674 RepID=UPI0035DF94C1
MQITSENSAAFLERFVKFYDAVIVGVDIRALPGKFATIAVELQAMDRMRPVIAPTGGGRQFEWCQVRLIVHGVHEYRFVESRQYPYRVLSDGLAVAAAPTEFVLDLDPGPDEWASAQIQSQGSYSKQYILGERGDFEVTNIL